MRTETTPRSFQLNFNPSHWKIRAQIIGVVILVTAVSAGAVVTLTTLSLFERNTQATGAALLSYGHEAIQRSADIVHGSLRALEAPALSPELVQVVARANAAQAGGDPAARQAEIAALDEAWKNGDPSVEPLVAAITADPVSGQLRAFVDAFPEQVEVFVTDQAGVNVAMTERTGDGLPGVLALGAVPLKHRDGVLVSQSGGSIVRL